MTTTLAQLLARVEVFLLDFDGPICRIFARLEDRIVADRLRQELDAGGWPIPLEIRQTKDPLEIIRYTGTLGDDRIISVIEGQLIAAEVEAAHSAEPTPYAAEVITEAVKTDRQVIIVSNNSAEAIRAYLASQRLINLVDGIVGRPFEDPARMKPNPYPVQQALALANAREDQTIMIGDSVTDMTVLHGTAIMGIGYANKPGKAEKLSKAGAVAVVEGSDGMRLIAEAL